MLVVCMSVGGLARAVEAEAVPNMRDREMRERYEQVLLRSPFQEQAFDRTYQLYALYEGIETWDAALADISVFEGDPAAPLILRARIAARQFDTERAVALLEEAGSAGASGTDFAVLLGRQYQSAGRVEDAVATLEAALDTVRTPDERAQVSRQLGSVFLRMGQRDEAIAAWERIAGDDAADTFALEELAALYESQRMWPEAVRAWGRVAEAATRDPYLRTRALRAMGDAEAQRGEYRAAAAAYREALGWVAPGNWLFSALTQSLLEVHAAMRDLEGLSAYLEERLRTDPTLTELRILLGDVFVEQADWTRAEAAYREAIERAPRQRAPYAALLRLAERIGDPAGIAAAYEEALGQFPGDRDYRQRLGEAYLRAGDQTAAITTWRGLLGTPPQPEDYALLARWLEQRNLRDEAREAYAEAVALAPNWEWALRLAALEFDAGDEEAARARWLALASDSNRPEEWLEIAGILEARGFTPDARDLLARAVEAAPDRLDFAMAKADLLLGMRAFEDAESLYARLADASDTPFYQVRGERGLLDVWQAQGRLADVRSEWEAAIRADRTEVDLRMRLARLCERMGDRGRALALYRECVAIDPGNADLLTELARIYETTGNRTEAIATYRRLIEIEPDRAGVHYRALVPLLTLHGNPDEAVEAARAVVARSPQDPDARIRLAQVLERFDRRDEAIEAYREAVRLAPDDPAHHEALGQALLGGQAVIEARESFRAMLETARDGSTRMRAAQHLAGVHARLDQSEELVRAFEERVQDSPRDIEAYELLAAVHRAGGSPREALLVLERAVEVADDRETALRRVLTEAHAMGHLDTVVRAFEQLEGAATALVPREWEQLGRAYAQLGRDADAERAWDRMADGHEGDANVLRAQARVFQEHGLEDRALGATARILDQDRYDYRTRREYAQQLAAAGRTGEAVEQLRTLLRLGAGPVEEADEEDPPQAAARTGQAGLMGAIPPHLATRAQHGVMHPGTAAPIAAITLSPGSGPFQAERFQALSLLAQYARQVGRLDEILAEHAPSAEDATATPAGHFDTVILLEAAGETDGLLAKIEDMRRDFAESIEVARLAAQYFELHRRFDLAMAAYETLHNLESANDPTRRTTRIRLMMGAGRQDEARAEIAALRESFPSHAGVLRQAASQLAALNDLAQAEELYRAVAEVDPRQGQTALQEMAHHYRNRGNAADAARLYGEVLLIPAPPGHARPGPQGPPGQLMQVIAQHGQPMTVDTAVRHILQPFDWTRLEAFNQARALSQAPDAAASLLDRLVALVEAAADKSTEERTRTLELAVLLAAEAIERGDSEAAIAWGEAMSRLGAPENAVTNVRLLALNAAQEFDALRDAYQELAAKHPERADDFLSARVRLAMQERAWDEAVPLLREQILDNRRAHESISHLRVLFNEGEAEQVRALLALHMEQPAPQPEAYGLRAQVLSALGAHDEAIAQARQSWEYVAARERSHTLPAPRSGQPPIIQPSPTGGLLVQVYRAANRMDEVIAFLEAQTAAQPGSLLIHLDLVHAYRNAGRDADAWALLAEQVARNPGDRSLRMAYARSLMDHQRNREAYEVLNDLITSDPSYFVGNTWIFREVYQRLGRAHELRLHERRAAMNATDPRTMLQLSNEATRDGHFEVAVPLLERLVRVSPTDDTMRILLAEAHRKNGNAADALRTWRLILRDLERDPGRTSSTVAKAAAVFDGAGERGFIENLIGSRLQIDPADPLGLILAGGLAQHDGDLEAAIDAYATLAASRPQDRAIGGMVVNLARVTGDISRAIALLEQANDPAMVLQMGQLGDLYAMQGDLERAIALWQQDATRHMGQHGLDRMLQRLIEHGAYDEALAYFEREAPRARAMPHQYAGFVQQLLIGYLRGMDVPEALLREVLREAAGDPRLNLGSLVQSGAERARGRQLLEWVVDEAADEQATLQTVLFTAQHLFSGEEHIAILERMLLHHKDDAALQANLVQALSSVRGVDAALAFIDARLAESFRVDLLEHGLRLRQQVRDRAGILAMRDAYWDQLGEDDRDNMTARWAFAFALAGAVDDAITALAARYEATPNGSNRDRLVDMLWRYGSGADAHAVFAAAVEASDDAVEGRIPSPEYAHFVHGDRIAELVELLWLQIDRSQSHQAANIVQNALSNLRLYGAAHAFAEAWFQRVEAAPESASHHMAALADGAASAQLGAIAAEALERALAMMPQHPLLLRRRAETLERMGALAEARVQYERAMAASTGPQRQSLLEPLLRLVHAEGDEEGLDRLLWQHTAPLPTQDAEIIQAGNALGAAGRHDASARVWALGTASGSASATHRTRQAAALARGGDTGAALALLDGEAQPQALQMLFRALMDTGAHEAAQHLVDTYTADAFGGLVVHTELLPHLLDAAPEPDALVAFLDAMRAYARFQDNPAEFARHTAEALRRHLPLDALLDTLAVIDDPAVWEQLAHALALEAAQAPDETRARAIATALGQGVAENPEAMWTAVEALTRHKESALAAVIAAHYARPASATAAQDLALARVLVPVDTEASAALFRSGLHADSSRVLEYPDGAALIGAVLGIEESDRAAWIAVARDHALYPAEAALVEAAIAAGMGDFDTAHDHLAAVAPLGNIEADALEGFVRWLDAAGHESLLNEVVDRVAEGGVLRDARIRILQVGIERGAAVGDLDRVVAYLRAWAQLGTAAPWRVITDAAEAWPVEAVADALAALRAQRPQPDSAGASDERITWPSMAWLDAALARLNGDNEPTRAIAEAWQVPLGQAAMIAMGIHAPASWWMWPPAAHGMPSAIQGPPDASVARFLTVAQRLTSDTGWRPVRALRPDPAVVPGGFTPPGGLGLEHKGMYLATDVHSPDARTVRFASAADDWHRVWVNGEEVHQNVHAGALTPGEATYAVRLEPGANRIVVWLGNDRGTAAVAFGIVDGGRGVHFAEVAGLKEGSATARLQQ